MRRTKLDFWAIYEVKATRHCEEIAISKKSSARRVALKAKLIHGEKFKSKIKSISLDKSTETYV